MVGLPGRCLEPVSKRTVARTMTAAGWPTTLRERWHVRRDGLLQTVLVWVAAGVALALLTQPLMAQLTPFLMLPLWAGYGLFGAGLLIAALVRLANPALRRGAVAALALALSFAALMWFGGWWGLARIGDAVEFRLRFARLEPRYAALVPGLLRDAPATSGYQKWGGVTVVVDSGPPKRLAFLQPGGIIDNWEGIVHDPTGAVAQARGWRYDRGEQEFTSPPAVRGLFGGDIVRCEHVRGPWYRCWFT